MKTKLDNARERINEIDLEMIKLFVRRRWLLMPE